MSIKGIIKKGDYFDSITLMIVSKKMREINGVIDSAVVMGSAENISILKVANLMVPEFSTSTDSDLLLVVSSESDDVATQVLLAADEMLAEIKKRKKNSGTGNNKTIIKSIEQALEILPEANLTLISVGGKFAYSQALSALNLKQNVMLFSDNMSIEEELSLKQLAQAKNLLVMGPDCGTAIISGVPLAFANAVRRGSIGVVGASGTGTQEVTSLIHNLGQGISHAIGTGGRDIKQEIGGISFLAGLSMLNEDEDTKVILLVAKPPHKTVLEKIGLAVSKMNKPVVAVFLGADRECVEKHKMIYAKTLEEGALLATRILNPSVEIECEKNLNPKRFQEPSREPSRKYIRALYSGGTYCYETQLMFKDAGLVDLYSNAPASGINTLSNSNISEGHTIVDLGEDEFTKGRPHPMIDYSLRNRRIIEDIKRADTAVMVLDLVIGYGSNLNPKEEFIPTIIEAKKIAPNVPIICFITGTDSDPQNRQELIAILKKSGVELVHTNAQAARLAVSIVQGQK